MGTPEGHPTPPSSRRTLLRFPLDWAGQLDARPFVTSILPVTIALAVGAGLAGLIAIGSWRIAVVASAALALPVAAQMSGNARLFLLWCLFFVLPFDLSLYLGPISDKGGGERAFRIEVSDVFLIGLLAFQLRDVFSRRWPGLRVPKLSWLWVLVMLRCLETAIEGPWRTTAVHELVRMTKVLLLFIVIANELDSPRRMLHAVGAMAFALLFQSSFGIAQWIHGAPYGLELLGEIGTTTAGALAVNSVEGSRVFRISAFIGHPNLLGIYLAAALPLCVGAFLLRRGTLWRLFFLCSAIASLAALMLTQSRSAWASCALALFVQVALMLMHQGLFRRSLTTLFVGLAGLVVVFAVFQEPILKRLFDSKEDATIGRAEFNEDAGRMIDAKPWMGWGVNTYVHEVPQFMKHGLRAYGGWIPPVHNIYYLWWAETGVVGLVVHLALWLGLVWVAWRNLAVRDETMFSINLACMAGLLAFAVDGFLSFSLRVNPISRLYFLLAGMVLAVHYWRLTRPIADVPDTGGAP